MSGGEPSFRVQRVASGEEARAWGAALATFDRAAARVLKDDAGAAVLAGTMLGREVVVKRWTLASLGARLKSAAGMGRADRHWRNALWLRERGIGTARCLALATERRGGALARWLVMEYVPGPTLLELMRSGRSRRQHAAAREVGRQLADFAAVRAFNRDHKPSNLIVRDVGGGLDSAVLDCVAIRRGRRPERMLASLVIEPSGCGVPVRSALAMRVLGSFLGDDRPDGAARAIRNRLWAAVSERVRAHSDPRPRVNPLAPPHS